MDPRQLVTFRTVANLSSFTHAASALDYAQSSVSAHVQALEKELGVPLFDRAGRRVVLTEAGQRMLEYANRILRLTDEARDAVRYQDEPIGTLVLSATETMRAFTGCPMSKPGSATESTPTEAAPTSQPRSRRVAVRPPRTRRCPPLRSSRKRFTSGSADRPGG